MYEKVGKYDNAFVPIDDFDFWLRAGILFKFGNCGKYVLKYRIVSGSASHGKVRKTEKITFRLRLKALKLGYKPTILDLLYNVAHLISFIVLPTRIKIFLFNKLRSLKVLS